MLDERIKNTARNDGETSRSELLTKMTPKSAGKAKQNFKGINIVKSPSDTTIYVPALKRIVNGQMGNDIGLNNSSRLLKDQLLGNQTNTIEANNTDMIQKVSNFVDQMRIEQDEREATMDEEDSVPRNQPRSSVVAPGLEEAQRRMERMIVETEKFKAAIKKPPGMG